MIPGTTPYIAVRDLTLCRAWRALFRGLTFDLVAGDRVAVIGDSGSGKSSLLQALLGRATFGTQVRPAGRIPHVLHGAILVGGLAPGSISGWPQRLAANAGGLVSVGRALRGEDRSGEPRFCVPPHKQPDWSSLAETIGGATGRTSRKGRADSIGDQCR